MQLKETAFAIELLARSVLHSNLSHDKAMIKVQKNIQQH